jgi:hypothetical protein
MQIRPYPAWALMAIALVVAAWRVYERPGADFALTSRRLARWPLLATMTTEELDPGLPHRYLGLSNALNGEREVGYFSEKDSADLWRAAITPGDTDRIQRYYMAQSLLPPSLLRLDAIRPLVVVDCAKPEQAQAVIKREGLTTIRDFGRGLILARPVP